MYPPTGPDLGAYPVKILREARELRSAGGRFAVAIGMFDGVHRGHQEIIRTTIAAARARGALSLALTFDQHPCAVVAPERVPPLLYSLPQKLRTISSLGLDAALLLHFDARLSRLPAEDFIRNLWRDAGGLAGICVGSRFTFGAGRAGNVALLRALGGELGFAVQALDAVEYAGEAISSTRIREHVRLGELTTASQMLGRPYALAGKVMTGDRLGRQLGFPTANVDTAGLITPPHGVYAAYAIQGGKSHQAVVNIGRRPTLNQPEPSLRVEAHLLDFDGDLYGQELELQFLAKLRDEKKFPSLEMLKAQIREDITAAEIHFQAAG